MASFAIVVGQLKTMYDTFFISCCNRCRGTGMITCQHCHGTKTLRRRPAFLRVRDGGLVSNPADCYQVRTMAGLSKSAVRAADGEHLPPPANIFPASICFNTARLLVP